MTRKEAIARIKDHMVVHKMDEPRAIFISEALNMAIKALEQEPRWIPVSERLPKEGEEVLVSGYDTYNKKVIIARYQGEQYGFTCGLVSAWMSLPEPYEPQESKESKSCDNCKWNNTEKCQPSTCAMIGYDGHGLWDKAENKEQE